MVVAVGAVRMVQVPVDEVVDVVAVGHGLVAAGGTVDVTGVMSRARVGRRAGPGVGAADLDAALVDVTVVQAMQVPVVQVVDVVAVPDGGVAAVGAVLVRVVVVDAMNGHGGLLRSGAAASGLRGMVDGGSHDGQDVVVCEGVRHVPTVARAGDELLRAQNPYPLRDGRQAFTFGLRQVRHAGRPLGESCQQAEACFVRQRAKQPRGAFERLRGAVEGGEVLTPVRGIAAFDGGWCG